MCKEKGQDLDDVSLNSLLDFTAAQALVFCILKSHSNHKMKLTIAKIHKLI